LFGSVKRGLQEEGEKEQNLLNSPVNDASRNDGNRVYYVQFQSQRGSWRLCSFGVYKHVYTIRQVLVQAVDFSLTISGLTR